MTVASMVQGIRRQIFNAIEVAGPTAFYVIRFFSQTPLNPDRLPYEVRIRPVLQSRATPRPSGGSPRSATRDLGAGCSRSMEYQGERTAGWSSSGPMTRYMEIQGGTLLRGRFFTRAELTGETVIVLESDVADRLFGRSIRWARCVRIGGQPLRVIGDLPEAGQHLRAAGPGDRWGHSLRDRAAELPVRRDQRPLHRGQAAAAA